LPEGRPLLPQDVEAVLREGERILTICNACRYCEGFCAVFPAMEKRLEFPRADLNYLANLCHNCGECFYACQYAPPHEFAVNLPRTLAQIRVASYEEYAWPFWGRRASSVVAWVLVGVTFAASVPFPGKRGDFYFVISHAGMVGVFGAVAALVLAVLILSGVRFWAEGRDESRPGRLKPAPRAALQALGDVLALKYLSSGGAGCTYPDEHHSQARRWFHHFTFYGFLLCFASTSVAAIDHYFFAWFAPYPYLSLPVLLGASGGVALLLGPAGLGWLKRRQDSQTANVRQNGLDFEFIALLFLTSLTGLLLLLFRESQYMAKLLVIHLGLVAALFITLPYGKFVHGLYRSLALVRYAREQE
jgi:citrate/tricarballylate utilization protein